MRHALQIQKDERFWVVTTLLQFFNAADRRSVLAELLSGCLGEIPPVEGSATWEEALGDAEGLRLFFEVSLPTPHDYRPYLADCLDQRVLIPYVLDSAKKAERAGKALEGTTKVDAVLVAPATGFAVLFEAKVLADASSSVGFDVIRNQIARNIDVMLDRNPRLREPLSQRRPYRTCFVLITPQIFRDHPQSRLYGWLMNEYQRDPSALQRDLRHRTDTDFTAVAARLGWLTWEACNRLLPGACPWLDERRNWSHAGTSSIASESHPA